MIILNYKDLQYERNDYIHASILEKQTQKLQATVADISNSSWIDTIENVATVPTTKTLQIHDYHLDEYLQGKVDDYTLALNMLPPGNRLIIESLWVNTPIVDVPYASEEKLEKADFKQELTKGIVKYPFTHEPWTEQKWSTLLFGHSTVDLRDQDNAYGYIFRKLSKIADGEEVKIMRKGKMYTYKVDKKEVVSPKEVGNTLSTYNDATYATLMACYPLYTSTNRMLVRAKLVDQKQSQLAINK